MVFDNDYPRYLPHLTHPGVLQMGLTPLRESRWIETDNHLHKYRQHKLRTRERLGDRVYMATTGSQPAQQELADVLLQHLVKEQPENYQLKRNRLHCIPGDFVSVIDARETLWNCSLWIADDLVIMENLDGRYCLTAASLCSPSHWRLEEKFQRPLGVIHEPIPHFSRELSPSVDRFFEHLKPEHPVVRFNWSLQAHDKLCQRPEIDRAARQDSRLYYRTERQSLSRLPRTGAVAFTIRVYVHPLETLERTPGAMDAMIAAINNTPPDLAKYKGFDELLPGIERYRESGVGS